MPLVCRSSSSDDLPRDNERGHVDHCGAPLEACVADTSGLGWSESECYRIEVYRGGNYGPRDERRLARKACSVLPERHALLR
jgi:hypothetical protein